MPEPRRSLPAEYRSLDASIDDVLPGERAVVARINTDTVDRLKTVIDPAGMSFRTYESTGKVVLWEHGFDPTRGMVPVGRNQWLKYRSANGDVLAKTAFGKDEYSQNIFDLYRDGTLKGFSVSILNDKSQTSAPTREELRRRPDWGAAKAIYRRSEMIEYSAVALPANPAALALAISRGLWVPDSIREGLPGLTADAPPSDSPLPRLVGRTFGQVHQALVSQLRSMSVDQSANIEASIDLYARGRV